MAVKSSLLGANATITVRPHKGEGATAHEMVLWFESPALRHDVRSHSDIAQGMEKWKQALPNLPTEILLPKAIDEFNRLGKLALPPLAIDSVIAS